GRVATTLQQLRPRLEEARYVVRRVSCVELVLELVDEERVERRVPVPVDLHQLSVAAHTRCAPDSDLRAGAEHLVGYLQRHAEDVLARERVVPGELKVMEGAFAVGEERIAADADEQPTFTSLDRLRRGVEADRHALDENLANRLGLAGLASSPVIDGPGLGAAFRFGEHERERSVGLRIS